MIVHDAQATVRPPGTDGRGLRLGGGSIDIRLDADRGVDVDPHDLDIEMEVRLP